MKATLEFDLPADLEEHRHALNGSKYYMALTGLDEMLRKEYKYGDNKPMTPDDLRTRLREIMADNGVDFLHE